MKVRIGTRGSLLALWQADHVIERLREAHGDAVQAEKVIFKTTGDKFLSGPLAEIGNKGLFTKELEESLADGGIDLAVHSLKDMPTVLPPGLALAATPVRADVRDCVVTRKGERPDDAQRIGTASLRRTSLARRRWPDAGVHVIRGNVQTRLGRLHEEGERRMDAVLLAHAGLLRLGIPEERKETLDFLPLNPEHWIPAPGQGALALEIREDDDRLRTLLAPLHHPDTATCVETERRWLRAVEGDCRVPVGALATIDRYGDSVSLRLKAFVGAPDGSAIHEAVLVGTDPEAVAGEVAEQVLAAGGADVLAALRAGR
jgi:hydroxymethylbilane synthase